MKLDQLRKIIREDTALTCVSRAELWRKGKRIGNNVEIIENKCEGMIRLVDLKEDYFNFDMQNHAIVGERTKKSYRLGDPIRIKVSKVNVIRRFLDFVPVE